MTQIPSRIPLFPLPDAVLFPHMPLPLHVFEPRYRKMTSDAMAGRMFTVSAGARTVAGGRTAVTVSGWRP